MQFSCASDSYFTIPLISLSYFTKLVGTRQKRLNEAVLTSTVVMTPHVTEVMATRSTP